LSESETKTETKDRNVLQYNTLSTYGRVLRER